MGGCPIAGSGEVAADVAGEGFEFDGTVALEQDEEASSRRWRTVVMKSSGICSPLRWAVIALLMASIVFRRASKCPGVKERFPLRIFAKRSSA
jgi:hypothetical protein